MQEADGPAPEKRIGDRERREVDARLQQAHADGVLTLTEYDERSARCWAARTRTDLDGLVADLPDADPAPDPSATERAGAPPARRFRPARVVPAVLAAVLGIGIVSADDAVAIFGDRTVTVAPGQDHVEVGLLFGSVEVVVPDDARVTTTGITIFGGPDCAAACDGTGTRPVVVKSTGGFGSVDVVRQSERAAHDAARDRDDSDDND